MLSWNGNGLKVLHVDFIPLLDQKKTVDLQSIEEMVYPNFRREAITTMAVAHVCLIRMLPGVDRNHRRVRLAVKGHRTDFSSISRF